MPVITIEGPETDKETKKEIIENLSKIVAEKYEFPIESITVLIHENSLDNIGAGGKQLSKIHK